MALSRKTKKLLKAYVGFKSIKGLAKISVASSVAYGLYRYLRGQREVMV